MDPVPTNMSYATRFFLIAMCVAIGIAAAEYGYGTWLNARLEQAKSQCNALAINPSKVEWDKPIGAVPGTFDDLIPPKSQPRAALPKDKPTIHWVDDPPVCEPTMLANDVDSLRGEQRQLALAYRDRYGHEPLGYFAALAALIVGVVPHVWYFGLRRLREVADAIRGDRTT